MNGSSWVLHFQKLFAGQGIGVTSGNNQRNVLETGCVSAFLFLSKLENNFMAEALNSPFTTERWANCPIFPGINFSVAI